MPELPDVTVYQEALARHGRLRWRRKGAKLGMGPKIVVARFEFPPGTLCFTEAGTRKRASLTAIRGEGALRGLDPRGIEPLQATFEQFAAALARENHTLKRSLTDPTLFLAASATPIPTRSCTPPASRPCSRRRTSTRRGPGACTRPPGRRWRRGPTSCVPRRARAFPRK